MTPWTGTHQAPLSVGLLRQKYWSGLPFPSVGDLPDPGIEPRYTCISGGFFTKWATRKTLILQACPNPLVFYLSFFLPVQNCFGSSLFPFLCISQPQFSMFFMLELGIKPVECQTTPVFLTGKSYGQRSLVDYSPWGHKELDTTEQLTLFLTPALSLRIDILQLLFYPGLVLVSSYPYPSEGRQNENYNPRKLTKLITWITALCNSMKLWTMLCRATQDGWVLVESSDKMWSTREGNGKPLQYSCLENPMNSMKRQKDMTMKDELHK